MAVKDISDRQVCEAYAEWNSEGGDFADAILIRMTGQPAKVCWRAMERADRRRLIDYGVSLRSGWLTDKGNALLSESSR